MSHSEILTCPLQLHHVISNPAQCLARTGQTHRYVCAPSLSQEALRSPRALRWLRYHLWSVAAVRPARPTSPARAICRSFIDTWRSTSCIANGNVEGACYGRLWYRSNSGTGKDRNCGVWRKDGEAYFVEANLYTRCCIVCRPHMLR